MKHLVEAKRRAGTHRCQQTFAEMDTMAAEKPENPNTRYEEFPERTQASILEEYGGWRAFLQISRI